MANWVSCKLSFTLISFAEQQGLDPVELFFDYPIPENCLTDPGQWITPKELDQFIDQFFSWYQAKTGANLTQRLEFLRELGRRSSELRSWGILDSVLRLMPDVFEVLERPQVFLGHFLSPAPQVQVGNRSTQDIQWQGGAWLPEYPQIESLLWGSLESLPTFMGQKAWHLPGWSLEGILVFPRCQRVNSCATDETSSTGASQDLSASKSDSMSASFSKNRSQASLEQEGAAAAQQARNTATDPVMKAVAQSNEEALLTSLSLSRELFREMVAVIEQPKKPRKRKHQTGESALLSPPQLHWSLPQLAEISVPDIQREEVPQRLQQNLNRMLDFFVRASQLVTLLAKQNPDQAQAWMKRLDWARVQQRFPDLVEESMTWVREWAETQPSCPEGVSHESNR